MEIGGVSLFFDYCSRTAKRKTNRGFECMYREILVLPCVELGLYGIKFIRFICFPFFLLLLLSSFFFLFYEKSKLSRE